MNKRCQQLPGNQRVHLSETDRVTRGYTRNAAEAVGVSLPSGMSEALVSPLASKGEEKIE